MPLIKNNDLRLPSEPVAPPPQSRRHCRSRLPLVLGGLALVGTGLLLWRRACDRRETALAQAAGLLRPGWRSTVHAVNGALLHVVEAGPAEGPLVILLHGFPEFWWAWRHQIDPLAAAGYRVVVPDLRGYNESGAPKGINAYRLDTLAADIRALAASYGTARFSLVGHDWGGVIAWHFASHHGAQLDHLVILNAPHPAAFDLGLARHPSQALRSSYAGFFQLRGLPERLLRAFDFMALKAVLCRSARRDAFEPGALERYAEAWRHPGALAAMLNYYRALGMAPSTRGERITAPTLILWGEKDCFLEPYLAHEALALCSRGRIRTVEGAGHWLHLEERRRVAEEIAGFLGTANGS